MSEKAGSGHSEDDVARSARRFRWLFQSSPNILAVLSSDGTIRSISESLRRTLGYDPSSVTGTSFFDLVQADDREMLWKFLKRRTNDDDVIEVRLEHRDGGRRVTELASSALTEAEELDGILLTARDITKRKDLERQILRTQRLESIGSLASGVAHDLNNILAPLMLSFDMLRSGTTDRKKLRMLEIMEASVKDGRNIIKQVLSFARGIEGDRTHVQLRHVVNDVISIVERTLPPSIRIESTVPKDAWMVRADVTQMHQVFMNLFVNARDAMPTGGTLSIAAENLRVDETYAQMDITVRPGSYLMLSVKDTGSGIPAKALRRIFDPFFTTKAEGQGTGLGLSMVRQIISGHEGTVTVESKVGGGTTFRILLPAEPDAESTGQTGVVSQPEPGGGELIIVADDKESVRDITKQTLEAFGYDVRVAADGAEALGLLVQEQVRARLLLTDYAMPVMDGHQLINAVRKMGLDVKIVVASGTSMTDQGSEDVGPKVDAILRKPFTAAHLLRTVHDLLHPGP